MSDAAGRPSGGVSLPEPATLLSGAFLAVGAGGGLLVSLHRTTQRIDRGQFADSVAGMGTYLLTVVARALGTPPAEYVAAGLVAMVVVSVVGLLLALALDAVLDVDPANGYEGRPSRPLVSTSC